MVTFTQIPEDYTPLGTAAVYAFESDEAVTTDLRITDAADDTLLAVKRFASVTTASFDAAPCLRRAVRVVPATGGTGVYPAAGRRLAVNVQAFAEGGERLLGTAPTRIFLACTSPAEAPALLTTMPAERLIARGECEELLLLFAEAGSVTVTAEDGGSLTAQSYAVATAGPRLFRLDTRDFPGAETLTVDAGACGRVVYPLVPATPGGIRLAWRSSAGSVEHYTFPVVRSATVAAVKRRAYGADGHVAAGARYESRQQLVSAYERQEVLESLAELLSTPDVWIASGDRYTPADVLTDEAVVRRHGTMSCLELEIRPKHKTLLPWN